MQLLRILLNIIYVMNLKRIPQSIQYSLSRKSNLKLCIIFNARASVKIKLACSKVLLLINYFDRRYCATNISVFVKVNGANIILKLNHL